MPEATRDRLHRLAAAHGLTLAQQIDRLVDESASKPRPTIGGYRSDRPLDAEDLLVVSPFVVAEADYMLSSRLGADAARAFGHTMRTEQPSAV